MQHSVWVAEVVNSNLEVSSASLCNIVPAGVLPKQFSFRRVWQGKGSQTAASKVPVHLIFCMSVQKECLLVLCHFFVFPTFLIDCYWIEPLQ